MPKKMGKPTKKTDERIAIVLECLADAMPLKRASEFAQIHPATLWKWIQADETLAMQVAYARSKGIRLLIGEQRQKDPWKILQAIDQECFREQSTVNTKVSLDHVSTNASAMIADAQTATARELKRLKLKTEQGEPLTEAEIKSLSSLSGTLTNLMEQQQKLDDDGGLGRLSDVELAKMVEQAKQTLQLNAAKETSDPN